MSHSSISRRSLARRVAAALATATLAQAYTEPLLAASAANGSVESAANGWIPEGAVKINANENPLGPCPEAAEAIYSVIRQGGRYLYESTFEFTNTLAAQEGLIPEYVKAFAGSSDPLHRTVLAFTNPTRSFVAADPGYEAGGRAAMFSGAQTILVPLSSSWAHDVKAMAAADASAGVIYVCNPNNPTGTLTSRADLEWLVDNKPAGAVVLLDEAYLHFTEASPATDLVAADKDIIVLRSFSKLYGMAGLRAGAALARPDLLAKIKPYAAGALPVTGMVGATASLRSKTVVPERRKLMRSVREDVFSCLSRNNIRFIPSESNCFMLDAQRPAKEFIAAMARENVFVGRVWPSMPTWSRITVGTAEEMAKFKQAVAKVMA